MRLWLITLPGIVLVASAALAQPIPVYPQSLDAPPAVGAPPASSDDSDSEPGAMSPVWTPPELTPRQVDAEVANLRAAMAREVPHQIKLTPARDGEWISRAVAALAAAGRSIDHPQLLVVVDRNSRVQAAVIMMARQDGPWAVIGGTRVSTGQLGRFDYYVTPTGVFPHTDSILDYRAEGTFNENHIRGLGLKGMRVWDFGWQTASKGWRADREEGQMRLLMHATDPANLEHRIGRPASKGCIRVPAAMNKFMDRHGVLDADYERAATVDPTYRAVLPPNRVPTPLAGDLLVVIDSALDTAVLAAPRRVRASGITPINSDAR
jgi:hypothetical protein